VAEKECCVIPQGLLGTPMPIGTRMSGLSGHSFFSEGGWCGRREGKLSRRPD